MKKIFSFFGCMVLSAVIGFSVSGYYWVSDSYLILMSILIPPFICAKIFMCFFLMRGQTFFATQLSPEYLKLFESRGHSYYAKVGLLNGFSRFCLKFLRMRARFVFIFGVMLAIAVLLVYCTFGLSSGDMSFLGDRTVNNLRSFSLLILSAVLIAFAHWAFHWRDYCLGSEYDARVEFKAKDYSEEVIEEKISRLRESGAFGS